MAANRRPEWDLVLYSSSGLCQGIWELWRLLFLFTIEQVHDSLSSLFSHLQIALTEAALNSLVRKTSPSYHWQYH